MSWPLSTTVTDVHLLESVRDHGHVAHEIRIGHQQPIDAGVAREGHVDMMRLAAELHYGLGELFCHGLSFLRIALPLRVEKFPLPPFVKGGNLSVRRALLAMACIARSIRSILLPPLTKGGRGGFAVWLRSLHGAHSAACTRARSAGFKLASIHEVRFGKIIHSPSRRDRGAAAISVSSRFTSSGTVRIA